MEPGENLLCLASHKGFGLSEKIRKQDHVMIANLVLRLNRGQKVSRNEFCSLVDELIECMLAVGPYRSRISTSLGYLSTIFLAYQALPK